MDRKPDPQHAPSAPPPATARPVPTPVRGGTPDPHAARRRDKRRRDSELRGRPREGRDKPTSARAFETTTAPTPEIESDIAEAVVERGDRTWNVRVLGRSGGRSGSGAVPLLLLGFWEAGHDGGQPTLEAVVVGRTLAEITPARLESALDDARHPGRRLPARALHP